uniref:Uncharacterized protein n=1 Tax=Caldiarchaeum subterraneum TaxID=311458 RepID=E6NAV6_CALS0|nr:hypothetical protein HGMM_F15C04C11 [Candidatus Caldarchaeum subterraneum]
MTTITYAVAGLVTVSWSISRAVEGIYNIYDVVMDSAAIVWVVSSLMSIKSKQVQHPFAALMALIVLWLLSVTISSELELTGFGTYMPLRLPLIIYGYVGLLIYVCYVAYKDGTTKPPACVNILTRLFVAIPLFLWFLHIVIGYSYAFIKGYFPPIWMLVFATILLILAIRIILKIKAIYSDYNKSLSEYIKK